MQQTGSFAAFDESGEQHKVRVFRKVIDTRGMYDRTSTALGTLPYLLLEDGTKVEGGTEESVNGKCEFFVGQLRLTAAKEDVDNATKM